MTQPRHTADHITDDALDALYAELERMKLLVAASSEDGQAVRMAAQYAERAIENGERAERAEAALNAITSPDAIRAAALAISDYALTHLGRDLGTIHIEPMAEAGIRAALDTHTSD